MSVLLAAGETVRHNKRKDWGLGKILQVERCGTIKVVFEGKRQVSIAKGSNFLTRESLDENK